MSDFDKSRTVFRRRLRMLRRGSKLQADPQRRLDAFQREKDL